MRVTRSSGVILALFGHFCKIEKAHIGAISWADICSADVVRINSPMAPDAKKLFKI